VQTITAPQFPVSSHQTRRLLLAVLGLVLVVIGAVAGIGAVGVLATFGTDSTLDAGPFRLSTPSAALVSDVSRMEDAAGVTAVIGWPQLRLSVASDDPSEEVFVGIGPADAVERYLADVAHDEVTDLTTSPWQVVSSPHRGSAAAAPPKSQPFWVTSAESPTADLTWDIRDGDHRLVVMNADGSAFVDADAELALALDHAFPVGLAVLAGGGLMALVGVVLVVRALTAAR
jgi:hypothetical protein